MAGAGMRGKVGVTTADGKAFASNAMLTAAKKAHVAIAGAGVPLGSGSPEAMHAARSAALRVAPGHIRGHASPMTNHVRDAAAKHVVMKPDFSKETKYDAAPYKSSKYDRLDPYEGTLDKLRVHLRNEPKRDSYRYMGKGEFQRAMQSHEATKAGLVQELRDTRNRRSLEQNRSGDQGDLFGGFKAKPSRPANWEAPSAIASLKAAEEAAKPKAAPVETAKTAAAAPNYSRMGIVELFGAMKAATGGQSAPGQLMRESRYHRQKAVTSMRDARIAKAKHDALKAQYDSNVSNARGTFEREKAQRGAPRNQMIDARIAMDKAMTSAHENRAKAKETQAEAKRVEKALPDDMRAAVLKRWDKGHLAMEVKPRGPLPAIPKPSKAAAPVAPPAPKPYRAPAENPATRKAKLGGPQDAVSARSDGNLGINTVPVKSIASSNGFHVIPFSAEAGRRPTFALVGPTGYAVRRDLSKADALALLRGGRSGKTLARQYTITTPGKNDPGMHRASKAIQRYERILEGRKAQEAAARKSAA